RRGSRRLPLLRIGFGQCWPAWRRRLNASAPPARSNARPARSRVRVLPPVKGSCSGVTATVVVVVVPSVVTVATAITFVVADASTDFAFVADAVAVLS